MPTIQKNNYFELLGLPVSFEIDPRQLNDNYRKIQKSIHPDKFANASDMERRLSVQKTAQINDAFQTLKIPLKRAIYLLSLTAYELSENDNSLATGFLMEQMELRENLAAVSSAEQPLDALGVISDDVKFRINKITVQLSEYFQLFFPAENNMSTDLEENVLEENKLDNKKIDDNIAYDEAIGLKVKELVLKMQFLNRLQEECMNMEEDLADHSSS
jgi:molecular chaperone HscB